MPITKKVQEYCGLNTELRSRIKIYQDMEVANMDILTGFEDLKKKYKELEEKVKPGERDKGREEEDNDQENINIEILAQFKQSGYRRSPNSERPMPKSQPQVDPKLFKCDRCNFKSVSEERLKVHYKRNHFNCDLCDITLGTAHALRAHNKNLHNAPEGTAKNCDTCGFSAVSEEHLRKHVRRHHNELNCHKCDFKTLSEYDLAEHLKKQHRRQAVKCKFGLNCRRGSACRFEHPNNEQRTPPMHRAAGNQNKQNSNTPWIHPAYVSQSDYNASFPFLVQAMWQMCRNRGA